MDLLGDLGAADQLTAARSENAVLQEKVKHLSFRVKELSIENESLKAEVEMYRKEAALPNFSHLALGGKGGSNTTTTSSSDSTTAMMMDGDASSTTNDCEDFIRSGNGVYPRVADLVLPNLHGNANLLSCALSADDTILATGGADSNLILTAWGPAWGCRDDEIASMMMGERVRRVVQCDGPVITVAFHPTQKLIAAGCMDGSVWIVSYDILTGVGGLTVLASIKVPTKHAKYVKTVAWRRQQQSTTTTTPTSLLASASADGTVQIHQVSTRVDYSTAMTMDDGDDDGRGTTRIDLTPLETLHLMGAVESLCFVHNELCCYARGKPYLLLFDTANDFQQRKINLNHGGRPAAAGTALEDQHVSFAVMDMVPSPTATTTAPSSPASDDPPKYLALATDASRNIVLRVATGLHVRNLYGHQNDGYSNPKIAWSQNGQYLLGNTQEEGTVCVWDIASAQLVERMSREGGGRHGQTVRDLFSSSVTNTLVTTSFDKQTKLWFAADN